jgi:hypothetical protein
MSLNNLKARLQFFGGANQQDRMVAGKLASLKRALLYSYQAATAQLENGNEFKCLINPDKQNLDLDSKILSIPFQDQCLNGSDLNEIETNLKEGDIFCWKENGSHWLVYMQYLEELAYFRADIRRCNDQIEFENGAKYWAYIKGPSERKASWVNAKGAYINQLNYTLEMAIPKNAETEKLCDRFVRVLIGGKPWQIQATDKISSRGVIELYLKEDYTNPYKDDEKTEEDYHGFILGPGVVYPYQEYVYESNGGNTLSIENESRKNAVKIIDSQPGSIKIYIETGKSGSFDLVCGDERRIIEIGSL